MAKIVNTSSSLALTDVHTKLNPHIGTMNEQGWELFAVMQQLVGIKETLVMFWRKTVES